MPLTIVREDIARIKADAIVNAANTQLQMGGGVCGAIFQAAGAAKLQKACNELAPIQTGEAVITPGFALPVKHIIHAAGPVYRDQEAKQSENYLRLAYRNSLSLAEQNNCRSIAFPLISGGTYGYPTEEAVRVAVSEIHGFLDSHEMNVTLAVFDKATFTVSRQLLGEVDSYIDEHYIQKHGIQRSRMPDGTLSFSSGFVSSVGAISFAELDIFVGNPAESFSAMLLHLIDAKGKTDVEIYKRANLDRKLFSKIRCNANYTPSKRTILALAVALELTLDETDALLRRAGFAFSRAAQSDLIVEYFIVNGKYDIFEINTVLFAYDQPLLGG